jgi:hypothetical protein
MKAGLWEQHVSDSAPYSTITTAVQSLTFLTIVYGYKRAGTITLTNIAAEFRTWAKEGLTRSVTGMLDHSQRVDHHPVEEGQCFAGGPGTPASCKYATTALVAIAKKDASGQRDTPSWDEWWGPDWINIATRDESGDIKDFINIGVHVDKYVRSTPWLSSVLTASVATIHTRVVIASRSPLGQVLSLDSSVGLLERRSCWLGCFASKCQKIGRETPIGLCVLNGIWQLVLTYSLICFSV